MRAKPLKLTGWGRAESADMAMFRPERAREAVSLLSVRPGGTTVRGGGRAYGDQTLNDLGHGVLTGRLDRLISFDDQTGLLVAEAGVTFADLLATFLPKGWQVPVSPGTGFATLGGAIANDIHGKNNEATGSFGHHVVWFDLVLPSGVVQRVEPGSDLFRATIGGIGLTGLILTVALQMRKVSSNAMEVDERRIPDLERFMRALTDARTTHPYAVGWIDALATGKSMGRGILELGRSADRDVAEPPRKAKRLPIDLPGFVLNSWSIRAFNAFYYGRIGAGGRVASVPVSQYLYPLDALLDWNRMYGKRGFHQFQCVLPDEQAPDGMRRLLRTISAAGAASFLAVIKSMGGPGLGMLSFAQKGFSLALDIPHRPGSLTLLQQLEAETLDHGGRIYLAKDSALSAEGFRAMYPEASSFRNVIDDLDPENVMNSDMARRLGLRT